MARCCKHSGEHSGSIEGEDFFDLLINSRLLKEFAHGDFISCCSSEHMRRVVTPPDLYLERIVDFPTEITLGAFGTGQRSYQMCH
jgi:hypothetical protein